MGVDGRSFVCVSQHKTHVLRCNATPRQPSKPNLDNPQHLNVLNVTHVGITPGCLKHTSRRGVHNVIRDDGPAAHPGVPEHVWLWL